MAFRLFGAKPLSEPMLTNCQLQLKDPNALDFNRNSVLLKNVFENAVCKMAAHLSLSQSVNDPLCDEVGL